MFGSSKTSPATGPPPSRPSTLPSPSRASIEEANSHLRAVHHRCEQLEQTIDAQKRQMTAAEDKHRQEVHRLVDTHDKHVQHMDRQMLALKDRIHDLEHKLEKQNYKLMEENAKQMEKLSQILKLTPNLEKLLKLLNSLMVNNNTGAMSSVADSSGLQLIGSHSTTAAVANGSQAVVNGYSDSLSALEDSHHRTHHNNGSADRPQTASIGQSERRMSAAKHSPPLDDQCIPEEVFAMSETSSINTPGRSPPSSASSVAAVATGLTVRPHNNPMMSRGGAAMSGAVTGGHTHHHRSGGRQSTNAKSMRIGRSFNITANFSDDEEQPRQPPLPPLPPVDDRMAAQQMVNSMAARPGLSRKKSTEI